MLKAANMHPFQHKTLLYIQLEEWRNESKGVSMHMRVVTCHMHICLLMEEEGEKERMGKI